MANTFEIIRGHRTRSFTKTFSGVNDSISASAIAAGVEQKEAEAIAMAGNFLNSNFGIIQLGNDVALVDIGFADLATAFGNNNPAKFFDTALVEIADRQYIQSTFNNFTVKVSPNFYRTFQVVDGDLQIDITLSIYAQVYVDPALGNTATNQAIAAKYT